MCEETGVGSGVAYRLERGVFGSREEAQAECDKRNKAKEITVQILLPTADSPFNKEDCRIVDVGYSDNIYVVECDAVVELQAENERLKEALKNYGNHLDSCGVRWSIENPKCSPCDCGFEQALKGNTDDD